MGKTTKMYNRINELYESMWEGVRNIPEVLDFKFSTKTLDYIVTGTVNLIFTLDDIISSNNVYVRIGCYKEKTPYFTFCLYKTNEIDLSKVHPTPVSDFGAYFDRILSMRVYNDFTKIVYSDGLKAEDINEYILKLEKMIYNYLEEHHCTEVEQINISEEAKKLEEMC